MSTRNPLRPYRAGRSKHSHMLVAWGRVHAFAWWPALGADSVGASLRYRSGAGWVHWRVVVLQRNPFDLGRAGALARRGGVESRRGHFRARRTLTVCELSRWCTSGGTSERVGLKAYVRLKVSPGGRQVA